MTKIVAVPIYGNTFSLKHISFVKLFTCEHIDTYTFVHNRFYKLEFGKKS